MYNFEDTIIKQHQDDLLLPSSAMLYDGHYFERLIEGYRTLSVTGREMLSLNLDTVDVAIGSVKINQTLPARTLKVTYQLLGKNAAEVQKKYHQLMRLLYREDEVEIRFKDAPNYSFYGQYVASDDVSGDTNSIISSFEILCSDPRKYSQLLQATNKVCTYLPYQTTPETIKVVIAKQDYLRISNSQETIQLTGKKLNPNDQVTIDFKKGRIFVNGMDQTRLLDLTSDFENFYLKEGQTITCTNGQATIFYREVLL